MKRLDFDQIPHYTLRHYGEHLRLSLFVDQFYPLFGPPQGALLGGRGDFTTLMCENRLRDDGLDKAKAIEHSRAIQEVLAFAEAKGIEPFELYDCDC